MCLLSIQLLIGCQRSGLSEKPGVADLPASQPEAHAESDVSDVSAHAPTEPGLTSTEETTQDPEVVSSDLARFHNRLLQVRHLARSKPGQQPPKTHPDLKGFAYRWLHREYLTAGSSDSELGAKGELLAVSGNGRFWLCADPFNPNQSQSVVVTNGRSNDQLAMIPVEDRFRMAVFSPDGQRLAVGQGLGSFRVSFWEKKTGNFRITEPLPPAAQVLFSPDGSSFFSIGKQFVQIDAATAKVISKFTLDASTDRNRRWYVANAMSSQDGKRIFMASYAAPANGPIADIDAVIEVDVDRKQIARTIRDDSSDPLDRLETVNANGSKLVATRKSGGITIWDASTGKWQDLSMTVRPRGFPAMLSPRGDWLAAIVEDGQEMAVYDFKTQTQKRRRFDHSLRGFAIAGETQLAVVGSRKLSRWNFAANQIEKQTDGQFSCWCHSPNRCVILQRESPGKSILWDFQKQKRTELLTTSAGPLTFPTYHSPAFYGTSTLSPDLESLVRIGPAQKTAGADIIDSHQRKVVGRIPRLPDKAVCAVDDSGKLLAIGTNDSVSITDMVTGDTLFSDAINTPSAIEINSHSRQIAVLGRGYRARSGMRVAEKMLDRPAPDGPSVAQSFIRVWDYSSGKVQREFPGSSPGKDFRLASNGHWFAKHAYRGGELMPLRDPDSKKKFRFEQIAFSGDGKFMAMSVGTDLKLLDPSGNELWSSRIPEGRSVLKLAIDQLVGVVAALQGASCELTTYDLKSGTMGDLHPIHDSKMVDMQSQDGLVCIVGTDSSITQCDLTGKSSTRTFFTEIQAIKASGVDRSSPVLVLNQRKRLVVYPPYQSTAKAAHRSIATPAAASSVALSPAGEWCAYVVDGVPYLIDLKSSRSRPTPVSVEDRATIVALSAADLYVASGSKLFAFNLETQQSRTQHEFGSQVTGLELSADGQELLAFAGKEKRQWRIANNSARAIPVPPLSVSVQQLGEDVSAIRVAASSTPGQALATRCIDHVPRKSALLPSCELILAGADGRVAIWDAWTLSLLQQLPAQGTQLRDLATSALGNVIATVSDTGIQLWMAGDKNDLAPLPQRHALFYDRDFDPQGQSGPMGQPKLDQPVLPKSELTPWFRRAQRNGDAFSFALAREASDSGNGTIGREIQTYLQTTIPTRALGPEWSVFAEQQAKQLGSPKKVEDSVFAQREILRICPSNQRVFARTAKYKLAVGDLSTGVIDPTLNELSSSDSTIDHDGEYIATLGRDKRKCTLRRLSAGDSVDLEGKVRFIGLSFRHTAGGQTPHLITVDASGGVDQWSVETGDRKVLVSADQKASRYLFSRAEFSPDGDHYFRRDSKERDTWAYLSIKQREPLHIAKDVDRYLLTASGLILWNEKNIQVFNRAGELLGTFPLRERADVTVSRDGKTIFTRDLYEDRSTRVYRVTESTCKPLDRREAKYFMGPVVGMSDDARWLIIRKETNEYLEDDFDEFPSAPSRRASPHSLHLIDTVDQTTMHEIFYNGSPVKSAHFLNGPKELLLVREDGSFGRWQPDRKSAGAVTIDTGFDGIEAAAASSRSQRLVLAGPEQVAVYSFEGNRESTFNAKAIKHVALTPDGWNVLLIGNGTAELRELRSGQILKTLEHQMNVQAREFSASFTPDAGQLLLADAKQLHLWDLAKDRDQQLPKLAGPAAFFGDQSQIVCTQGAQAVLYSPESDQVVRRFQIEGKPVQVSHGGRWIVAGSDQYHPVVAVRTADGLTTRTRARDSMRHPGHRLVISDQGGRVAFNWTSTYEHLKKETSLAVVDLWVGSPTLDLGQSGIPIAYTERGDALVVARKKGQVAVYFAPDLPSK